MRSDRYTKVVLTIIAVGLWALMLTEIGLADLTAQAEATAAPPSSSALQDSKKPSGDAGPVRAPTATLPLRWRVAWAVERSVDTTHCGTAIVVTNSSNSTVDVQVEWFNYAGSSHGLHQRSIDGMSQNVWVTGTAISGPDTDYRPFEYDSLANIPDILGGYARVHANDPRIQVAAFQYCRDGTGITKDIMSITNIPAFPVGATAEYFQAGMPATWTPPMAEVPE
jgi:hypothetical protein